jgi:aspartyl-tRNA(Asn)/glutamyl-tRNA(Gln) amidotransferase subunit B
MSDYRPTIGLEIHAELHTRTKMFCDSQNDPDEARPNQNVCPVCMAHPGTLPTVNREAVRHVLRVGTALGGALADYAEFDRKSYFYPDIPKGYQISQYEHPLVSGGELAGIQITRVHLEEDTARSSHADGASLVDFNRAGLPLMELVTEPVIHDAETAGRFARELQLLLRTLGASEANLEKGQMRIEANVSISKTVAFGTKVEVKNINSFRAVERAIAYEIERQANVLDAGGTVLQETRGWDEDKQQTFSQRLKEGSADYRYFPDPDIPKLVISEIPEFSGEALRASMPELPWEKRARYESLGVKPNDAAHLAGAIDESVFFDQVAGALGNDPALVPLAVNYLVSDVVGWHAKHGEVAPFSTITPESFAALIRMAGAGELSSRGVKDTLLILLETEATDPRLVAEEQGLMQVSDAGALAAIIDGVLAGNPSVVEEYKGGKESVIQFLVGMGMKASKGAGNPAVIKQLLEEKLRA